MQLARKKSERQEKLVGVVPEPSLPAAPGVERMFLEIFYRVAPRALRHARRFLDRDQARDAVANAVEKSWRHWKHQTPEQMNDAYLYRAIHNEIISLYRENKRLVGLDDVKAELAQIAIHEIDAFTRATTAEDVMDLVVAAMPARRREVLLLVQQFHFTYKEVAEMLGLSVDTVHTHVRIANEEIRAAFRGRDFKLQWRGQLRLEAGGKEESNG